VPPEKTLMIFTSRFTTSGNIGGRDGANEKCNLEAAAAKLSGRWIALLSDSKLAARDLIGAATESGAIYNSRGEVVSTSRAELWDGTLRATLAFDALGEAVGSPVTFTGMGLHGAQISENPQDTCQDWTDDAAVRQSFVGHAEKTDTSWHHLRNESCDQTHHIYCIGIRQEVTPTSTPSQTPTSSPTPSVTPTETETSQPSPTFTPTVTMTATPSESPVILPTATPSSSPTTTPQPTPTKPVAITPTPTPANQPSVVNTPLSRQQAEANVIAGDSKVLIGAIVYAPEALRVAVGDTQGAFKLEKITSTNQPLTLLFRGSSLPNGGFDLKARAGEYLPLPAVKTAPSTLPPGCRARDRLLALYNGALRVSKTNDLLARTSSASTQLGDTALESALSRAAQRARIHGELYYRASAVLPDTKLTCPKTVTGCLKLRLSSARRTMFRAVAQLRSEQLLRNRLLRQAGMVSPEDSKKAVRQIRQGSIRLKTLVGSLPRVSYTCDSVGTTATAHSLSVIYEAKPKALQQEAKVRPTPR
jgi:hypothetical protein